MRVLAFLVGAVCCCSSFEAAAQEWHFARYDQASGLPSGFVTEAVQDSAGYLWLGTDRGLALYNGRVFRTSGAGLNAPSSMVMRLRAHPSGGVAVLYFGGLLLHVTADGAAVRMDSLSKVSGHDFALLPGGGRLAIQGKSLLRFAQDFEEDGRLLFSLQTETAKLYESEQRYLIADGGTVLLVDPDSAGAVREVRLPTGPGSPPRPFFLLGVSGRRLLFTDRLGAYAEYRIDNDRLTPGRGFTGLHSPVDAAWHRGRWFLVSEFYGVQAIDPANPLSAVNVSTVSNLTGTMFRDVMVDRDSVLWVGGFGSGLFKMRTADFETVRQEPALKISRDEARVWIFDPDHLHAWPATGGPVEEYLQPQPGFHAYRNVFRAPDGRHWFGSYRYLYGPWDARSGAGPDASRRAINYGISRIAGLSGGRIAYATYGDGIRILHPESGNERHFTTADGLPGGMIEDLYAAGDTLWFSTFDAGAGYVLGDSIRVFGAGNGLLSNAVNRISNPDGSLVLCLDGGIAVWKGGVFSNHPMGAGSREKILNVFFQAGRLYAVGESGLLVLSGGRLQELNGIPLILNPRERILAAEYQPETQWLWVNTTSALRRHRLPLRYTGLADAAVVLEDVVETFSDGTVRQGFGRLNRDFPPDLVELRLRLARLSYIEEDRHKLYYRINGGALAEAFQYEVGLLRPASGRYRIEFFEAPDDEDPALLLQFEIEPPVWQRFWFLGSAFVVAVALAVALVRWLLKLGYERRLQRLETERRLQVERNRIARELHDSVGASLTYIITRLDDLEKVPAGERTPAMTRLKEFARDAMNQLRETIWAVNKEGVSARQLAEKLHSWALKSVPQGMQLRYEPAGPLDEVQLSPNQTLNLYRIMQEAVNNAIKHSRAGALVLQMNAGSRALTLTIVDNGCGFEPGASAGSESYGLVNMRTRAQEIGAVLEINSSAAGTAVQVNLAV